jgi:hypothetical protein
MVLKPEGQKYQTIKKFKKCTTVNTEFNVKKHHSQSEVRAISIYLRNQSEMRLIKLLT